MGVFLVASSLLCAVLLAAPRVRAEEPGVHALIQEGLARSGTFRQLVMAFDDTDVVVYVRPSIIRGGLGGYVPHRIIVHDGRRYVLVIITAAGSDHVRIGIIAHELQHAVEIARVVEAGRSETVTGLFARIGFRGKHPRDAYETMAAVRVQETVRAELLANRRDACATER